MVLQPLCYKSNVLSRGNGRGCIALVEQVRYVQLGVPIRSWEPIIIVQNRQGKVTEFEHGAGVQFI